MGPQVTSKHLQGITDLTLVADVRQDLVPCLDTVSYEMRLQMTLRALTALRSQSREYAAIKPFSDTVERIQQIQSFRLAVLEPLPGAPKKLLLAVAFDGGWEPYIRRIWRDLGPLLDVMFCNCTDYKVSTRSSFEDYVQWIRSKQVDTGFFYVASATTVTDLQYLRQAEKGWREARDPKAGDLAAAQLVADDPEKVAQQVAASNRDAARRLGLTALSALYRLRDFYLPQEPDGEILVRATRELLREIETVKLFPPDAPERAQLKPMFDWLEQGLPVPQPAPERLQHVPGIVQDGIVASYDRGGKLITHGCALLMQVVDPARARAFLGSLPVSVEGDPAPKDGIYVNVALSAEGLARLGVPEEERNRFPKEFREGMESRAGLLGDLRSNHPRNWTLPRRNWPAAGSEPVQMALVDMLVQLRVSARPVEKGDDEIVGNARHPLAGKVAELAALAEASGVRLLSVETMFSIRNREGRPIGHLGFVDDASQPVVQDRPDGARWDNSVRLGEMLYGYSNSRGDGPPPPSAYLDNGSFLVIRKLRLDLKALDALTAANAAQIDGEKLLAKMLGRTRDGEALGAPGNKGNDFTYDADAQGTGCPFQSHVRRANPRTGKDKPAVPRLMRRGMSYGALREHAPDAERGLMFMAYNASIAEQFEVIQRWVSGGNASGVFSGESDPLLGVPQLGDPRTFRFLDNAPDGIAVRRVDLDAGIAAGQKPFARLEWGGYYFAPSRPAIQAIAAGAPPGDAGLVAQGEKLVQRLLAIEASQPAAVARQAWKAYLEDLGSREMGYNAAIWAAIRAKYGGALWTAYGVLVANGALVDAVLRDPHQAYTVEGHGQAPEGYKSRTRDSIGEIFLGLDAGPAYEAASRATNGALMQLKSEDAFNLARATTLGVLNAIVGQPRRETPIDIKVMLSDQVLARVSRAWFGLPDDKHVMAGGWDWDPQHKPRCPGDFTSPSRYIFSAQPGAAVKDFAVRQGQALQAAVRQFVAEMRPQPEKLTPLCKVMFDAVADDRQLASTLIGVMMGFLPTVDGNLRTLLNVWLTDRSLWRLQADLLAAPGATPYEKARAALLEPMMRGMQRRPVPDMVWRTATRKHDLGPVSVQAGERVVIGIVSATQEKLLAGQAADVMPVFGGARGPGGPTHACPGYAAGMGLLLGMIAGLLEAGTLKPAPAPLTVYLS